MSIQVDNSMIQTQTEEQQSSHVLHDLQRIIHSDQNRWIQKLYGFKGPEPEKQISTAWELSNDDPWSTSLPSQTMENLTPTDTIDCKAGWSPCNDPVYANSSDDFSSNLLTNPNSMSIAHALDGLNASQQLAVRRMLDNSDATVIQGPPGTGKTTVITAFVQAILENSDKTIWLTAQSNIAVKNIALKLLKNSISKWKLLVSSDFYTEW